MFDGLDGVGLTRHDAFKWEMRSVADEGRVRDQR